MPVEPPSVPDQDGDTRDRSRHATLMSAFVYPGAGQWIQRRRLAAGLFIVSTTFVFGWICWIMIRPAFVNLAALLELGGATYQDTMDFGDIVASLTDRTAITLYVLLTCIYAGNLIDVWWAGQKRDPS